MRVLFALFSVVYLAIPALADPKKPPPPKGNVFMELGGIKGESTEKKHSEEIMAPKAGGTVRPTPMAPAPKTAK